MELNGSTLSQDQQLDMTMITEAICQKFEIQHIFLFGFRQSAAGVCSCFNANHHSELKAYCFLVVTHTRQSQQHTIQDFLSRHFPELEITVLSHWGGQVGKLLAEGNHFFTGVFKYGLLLTTSQGYNALSYSYGNNPSRHHQDAQQYFLHHSALARGFLASARQRHANQDLKLCLFFLHQTIEQAAIGLIRVWMGYRYNIHHLSRLLTLCRYFSPKIAQIFTSSKQDRILLQKLNRAYLDTRYQNDFQVCAIHAQALLEKAQIFKDVADGLCKSKLASFHNQTDMLTTS